jgi:hypothetical protein
VSRRILAFKFNAMTFAAPLVIVLLAFGGCSSNPKSPESAASAPAPAPASPTLETIDADASQETVQYVSNIYKYYVAYKMAIDQQRLREQGKQAVKAKS